MAYHDTLQHPFLGYHHHHISRRLSTTEHRPPWKTALKADYALRPIGIL